MGPLPPGAGMPPGGPSLGPLAPGGGGTMGPLPPGAGAPGMQPRPGMGWGAAPGAGPMGVPGAGASAMAGAGGAPGMPPALPGGMGQQQQALRGAIAGRGTGVPGAGMPPAAPSAVIPSTSGATPQQVAAMQGLGIAPGAGSTNMVQSPADAQAFLNSPYMRAMQGGGGPPGAGFAEGGPVVLAKGGKVSTFNSTKAAPGNLPTRPGKAKLAKGGVLHRKPPKPPQVGKLKEDRKSPSPVSGMGPDPGAPSYDQPAAGQAGWPPTPDFGGAPAAGPGMAKGGKVKKAKGGVCKDCGKEHDGDCKMAQGGVAKLRRGFPNTVGAPKKKMATGGAVRGAGAAQRGTRFSGIY